MNVLNLLVGLNSVILIFLIVNVFKPFIGSYAAKKGENLATKEDIAQLTKIAEGIKAKISDEVWDRQKQWEMRRDVVFEVMRALGELQNALLNLSHIYSIPAPERDDLRAKVLEERDEARKRWDLCNGKIDGMGFLVDMVVGRELGKSLLECVIEMASVADKVLDGDTKVFMSSRESISQKVGAINTSARKELKLEIAE
jgi:hypothetical protein